MKRGANKMVGRPVLTEQRQRRVGTISAVAFTQARDRIVGFLVRGPELDALPYEAISKITDDAVIIRDDTVFVDAGENPDMRHAVDAGVRNDGLLVVGGEGQTIGTIEDTIFDDETGRIEGFRLSERREAGLSLTLGEGKPPTFFLPAENITNWSEASMGVVYTRQPRGFEHEPDPSDIDRRGQLPS